MEQGMMFGKEEEEEMDSTQVTIPKDVRTHLTWLRL